VPNICLAAVGVRTKVRIFFPRLYVDKGSVELSQEHKAAIYEQGLLPVITNLNPDTITNWSVNYNGALTRARKNNGTFQYSTRPFPSALVRRFGYDLVQCLSEKFPWARHLLFMTQVQGVKEANQHRPESWFAADAALDTLLCDLDDGVRDEEHCYVDVGLELAEPGYAYQWRTDAHQSLITAFTTLTNHQAAVFTRPASRCYHKDYSSGLVHLSGFRVTLGLGGDNPVYMQAYTTDKALIQQLDNGRHGLTFDGRQALRDVTSPFLERLHGLYFDAKDNHDCAARFEVRLPIRLAVSHALDFPRALMRSSLCVFSRLDWW
jgi:hypothetical protein